MSQSDTTRTRYQLLLDTQYGRIYNGLQARLFERVAATIDAFELLAGTAAMAALLAEKAFIGTVIALTIAAVPILNKTLDPRGKAIQSRTQERAFVALLSEAPALSDEGLEKGLWAARGTDFVEGLRRVAFNQTMVEAGHQPAMVLGRWESALQAVA